MGTVVRERHVLCRNGRESKIILVLQRESFSQWEESQSCVNYNRWGAVQRNPVARRALLEQQKELYPWKEDSSLSHDHKPRQTVVHSSPRWNF
ncbi:hypothetical protein M0R45_010320 [Rubus argutus]|uniref:Uncharacterized protein n=1 Tax=Rubus argutus TaxID=59490 RepID=A0AAW1Y8H1_RUBAR